MTTDPGDRTLAQHQSVLDNVWWQDPDRQNSSSSSWWFFILFPEGEEGYGPRQLMFSVASRAGDRFHVNETWAPGMDLDRPLDDGEDQFNAISVGWSGDDQQVYDRIVAQPATATLSPDGSLDAWADREDGLERGGEIRESADRPLGLDAHFVGENGEAQFEAWGDLETEMSSPVESMDVDTPVGGTNLITWRQMEFEGEFETPDGRETLEGQCYFQRVCLNVPLFPWKWVWALFPDGTVFSVLVPYVGPQLFRKGYKFFSSNVLERATLPVRQSGLWHWGGSNQSVEFDSIRVSPVLGSGEHPDFEVRARNQAGDHVEFVASSYGHARNYIERPILGGRTRTHWTYNEYLIRMNELQGRVDGRPVNATTMGQGFGTLEYTWGMGL
jgi:hypothetical protein